MRTFLLVLSLIIIVILLFIIFYFDPSEQGRIKRFKHLIKRKYNVDVMFIKRTKKLGDNYYVFNTNNTYFTVSENGFISNIRL